MEASTLSPREYAKQQAGYKACELLEDGMTIGLGTGSTAYYAIERTAQLVAEGLRIQAVPTSSQTETLAKNWGIPLLSIDEVTHLDVVIDGVDEMDTAFNAIKGGGGALFREKMVAKLGHEVIWIMDETKAVPALGAFPLPIEILPFGATTILRHLDQLGLRPRIRSRRENPLSDWDQPSLQHQIDVLADANLRGQLWVTDNHNYLVDLLLEAPLDLPYLQRHLAAITGVLETGLFLNLCSQAIIAGPSGVSQLYNPHAERKAHR